MKRVMLFLLICSVFLSSGCDTVEINAAAVPLGLAMDYQNGQSTVIVQLAQTTSPSSGGSSNEPKFQVLSAQGGSIAEAARKIMLELPRLPLWSQAGVLVVGEDLANTDLALLADFLARNRNVRKNIPVFVTIGAKPQQVFQTQAPLEDYSARALSGILEAQRYQLGYYEPVELNEFLQKLASPGVEPVLPQVRLVEEDGKKMITLDGLAVFHGRKMVGSLNENQSRGYRWLRSGIIQGGLIVIPSPLSADRHITLELLRSQATVVPDVQGNHVTVHIKIKAEGNFYESDDPNEILTLDGLHQVEENGEEAIKAQITDSVQEAHRLHSDIFGWGQNLAASHPQEWKSLEGNWEQIFPMIQPDIQVEFNIRRTYLTYKTFPLKE
ncbi:MAG TPA: Ger(x)C family spore germination protein [Syntrophomonadaceae bacterium]|nr:Ger(x)C family spore germination protein [Syntrophomonadaceae bacterium]